MPSARFPHARFLLLAASTVAGLVVAAYLALPALLAGWLHGRLAEQGLENIRLDLGYPGLHGLRIHRVAFRSRALGQAFDLDARDIEIEYDYAALAAGRANRLRIPKAELRITPTPAVETKPRQPTGLPLPGGWVAAFPLNEVLLEQLRVEWQQSDSAGSAFDVRSQTRRSETELRTRWSAITPGQPATELEMTLTTGGTLTAALFPAGKPAQAIVRTEMTVAADGPDRLALRGSFDARLDPLASLLSPWFNLPAMATPVNGRLQARWNAAVPATWPAPDTEPAVGPISGTLSADLTALRLGNTLQDGQLHADATLTAVDQDIGWRIRDTLRLSAYLNRAILTGDPGAARKRFVRPAKPFVLRAPRGVAGRLTFMPDKIALTLAAKTELVAEHLPVPLARIAALTLRLAESVRLTCSRTGAPCHTGGIGVALTAPLIEPEFAGLGNIENLAVTTRVNPSSLTGLPPLTIDDAAVTLLGARVHGHTLRYDPAQSDHRFNIEVDHLDLARVVALEQQEEIEASGLLDGQLPIRLTASGLSMTDGRLHARAPGGVIRYHPTETVREMADANPNIKLVLLALGNYHYDKLDIGADYAENGDLALRVAMTGRNPEWNAGQAINLNINLSENVPTLLRSLRLADDISGEIEKRVRERPGALH